jgi:hypothetical protein
MIKIANLYATCRISKKKFRKYFSNLGGLGLLVWQKYKQFFFLKTRNEAVICEAVICQAAQLYGMPHGTLQVFIIILYENVFQNP